MEPTVLKNGTVEKGGCNPGSKLGTIGKTSSKYGTVGTGGCKKFLKREPLEPPVSKYGTVGTGGGGQVLNKKAEQGGGLNAKYKEVETGGMSV